MNAFRNFQHSQRSKHRASKGNPNKDCHYSKFASKDLRPHPQDPPSWILRSLPVELKKEHLPKICSVVSKALWHIIHFPIPMKLRCCRGSQVRILDFMANQTKYFIFPANLRFHNALCHPRPFGSSRIFNDTIYAKWALTPPIWRLAFQIIRSGIEFRVIHVSYKLLT